MRASRLPEAHKTPGAPGCSTHLIWIPGAHSPIQYHHEVLGAAGYNGALSAMQAHPARGQQLAGDQPSSKCPPVVCLQLAGDIILHQRQLEGRVLGQQLQHHQRRQDAARLDARQQVLHLGAGAALSGVCKGWGWGHSGKPARLQAMLVACRWGDRGRGP